MPTLAQARKAWEHGHKSKLHYEALTPEQKSAFWDYGYGQGLVDPNTFDDYKRSEYNRYATKTLRFAPQVATSKTMYDVKESKDEYDNEGNPKKIITTAQKLVPGNGVYDRLAIAKPSESAAPPIPPVNPAIADKRRLQNAQRLEAMTPSQKPQTALVGNLLPREVQTSGNIGVETAKVLLSPLSTINSVLQTPATMGKYGVTEMNKAKAEGKSAIGGLLKGYGTGLKKAITNQDAVENTEVIEGIAPKVTALKEKFPKTYNAVSTIVNMFGIDDLTAIGLIGDIAKVRKLNSGINTTADLVKMSDGGKVARLIEENPEIAKIVDDIPPSEIDEYYNYIGYLDEVNRKSPGYIKAEVRMNVPKAKEIKTLTNTEPPKIDSYTDEYLDSIGEYENLWNQQKTSMKSPKSDILNTKGVSGMVKSKDKLSLVAKENIKNMADNSNTRFYGLRIDSKKYKSGETLRKSRVWEDDIPTKDTLDGTSTIWLYDSDSDRFNEKALKRLEQYIYKDNDNVYLVKGDYAEGGNDVDEWIIRNAEVVDNIGKRETIFNKPQSTSLQSGVEKKITANKAPSGVFSLQPPKLEGKLQPPILKGQTLKPNKSILSALDAKVNKPYIEPKPLEVPKSDILPPGIKKINQAINTPPLPPKSLTGQIQKSNAAQTAKEAVEKAPAKKDISGFQAYTTDVYRNFEKVFGEDYPAVKKDILDPFDEAKKAKAVEDRKLMGSLKTNIVDKLGINKKSPESALVQQFGEKRLSYESLVDKVGKAKADKIVEADKWFRSEYDRLIDEINEARTKIYPYVENSIQDTKTKIAKYIDAIQTKTKELESVNVDTKKYETLQQQISNLKEKVNKNQGLLQSDELWRGKRIPKRADYYRHFKEMSEDFAGLKNVFETPSQISPKLAGISEYTKPNAKFLGIAQKRGQGKFTDDAVGGFLDYINAATYAKHIDTQIPNFRSLQKELGDKTIDTANMNNFLQYLTDFTDDLAGKTNPFDRPLQKIIPGGRMTFKALNWLNSRVKSNTILANLSSSLSQIANVPQGMAYVKNPEQIARGASNYLASIFGKGDAELYKQSGFLLERTADNVARQFDTKWIEQPKKVAAWTLGALDEVGTKFIWSSTYQKALADGIENPIKYADDITRKMVAGRGIGEVPLLQKSKLFQLVAPFTLEVNNLWKVQKDFVKAKDFGGLALLYLANFVLNRSMEEVRGNGVVFDPINAIAEASGINVEQKGFGINIGDNSLQLGPYKLTKTNEKMSPLERAGRLGGEVLSNMPLGSTAASLYPEYGINNEFVSLPTREKLFGRNDPTRFGSGLLVVKGLQDPLFKLAPPFAGGQAKKTIQAGQDLGLLPRMKKEEGKVLPTLKKQDLPASYSNTKQGDRMRTTINPTALTILKGLAFGRGAIPEVKKYYESGKTPLGTKQTENIQKLIKKGYEPNKLFETLNGIRGINKKADIVVKLRESGYNNNQIAEIWEVFYK